MNQDQRAWERMQLTIVMAQKGDVICAELCGDLDMIDGGLEHRWSRHTHLHQRMAGEGAWVGPYASGSLQILVERSCLSFSPPGRDAL